MLPRCAKERSFSESLPLGVTLRVQVCEPSFAGPFDLRLEPLTADDVKK